MTKRLPRHLCLRGAAYVHIATIRSRTVTGVYLAGFLQGHRTDPEGFVRGEGLGPPAKGFWKAIWPPPQKKKNFSLEMAFWSIMSGIFENLGTICISVSHSKFCGLAPLSAMIYASVYSSWTFLMRQLIARVYPLAYFFERFVELYSNTFGSVGKGRVFI